MDVQRDVHPDVHFRGASFRIALHARWRRWVPDSSKICVEVSRWPSQIVRQRPSNLKNHHHPSSSVFWPLLRWWCAAYALLCASSSGGGSSTFNKAQESFLHSRRRVIVAAIMASTAAINEPVASPTAAIERELAVSERELGTGVTGTPTATVGRPIDVSVATIIILFACSFTWIWREQRWWPSADRNLVHSWWPRYWRSIYNL